MAKIFCVLSNQCRTNKNYFIMQAGAGLCFSLQFGLLLAWSGFIFNVFGLARAAVCEIMKKQSAALRIKILERSLVACALIAIFVLGDVWHLGLMIFTAQSAGTIAMCLRCGKLIRLAQLCVVSPTWLAYDIIIPDPSVGGIICKCVNMFSVVIAFLRHKKTGFEAK